MKKMRKMKRFMILAVGLFCLASCTSVKEYQKSKINDAEMSLTARPSEKNEQNFQLYREGASGANGGKTSGGCGCN